MSDITETDWKEVPKKKRAKKRQYNHLSLQEQKRFKSWQCSSSIKQILPLNNWNKIVEKIFKYEKEILSASKFMNELQESFRHWMPIVSNEETVLSSTDLIVDIVCYGLGSLSSSMKSQYQMALVLILRSLLQISGQIYVYDPVFNDEDKEIVNKCGCTLILHNEEGKRSVQQRTLFFMPHCGRQLYSNVLWANWSPSQLEKILILGNSFSLYEQNRIGYKPNKAKYLFKVLPFVEEIPIGDYFGIAGIFNNQSLHWFKTEKLQSVDPVFWCDREEEISDPNDPEIITVPSMKNRLIQHE